MVGAAGSMVLATSGRAVTATPRDAAFVDALTWGVNPSSMAAFRAAGRERWLQAQLHPPAEQRLPKPVVQQINALMVTHRSARELTVAFDLQGRTANQLPDPDLKAASQRTFQDGMSEIARQAAAGTILRALYTPDQLRERMTWFWFNHFNAYQYKANLRVLIGDYIDNAIRPHALGNFRDLLMATLRHPAMLRYLDNADNAAGHINENYAREILELHTMGVGSGYSQKDVEELARILTGVGIDPRPDNPKLKPEWEPLLARDGLFEFNPARHDFGDKMLLGVPVRGSGFAEIEQTVDILCAHPATAVHLARQIALYFVADDPPKPLVDRMEQTFTRSRGAIGAVLDTLFHAPEFIAAAGTRFKDPMRFVLSAVRLAYDDKVIVNTIPIQNWLNRLGEGLFNRPTPDGYPMVSSAWNASGQMMTRFEIARQIGTNSAGLFRTPEAGEQPAFPLLQNALYFDSLRAGLSAQTQAALDKAVSPQEWNTLFLSSPEFMR
jgi:uncharacterized protein (DUF1800 family)